MELLEARPTRFLALAIALTIVAGSVLAISDSLGKILTARTNIWQAAWARYAVHTLFVAGLLWKPTRAGSLKTTRPCLQLLRGALLLATTILMYAAIMKVPLANATTIQFLAPILVVLWAGLFLNETIRPRHWVAVAGGFCGTLVVIGPDIARFLAPEVLMPLGVAVCLSAYLVLTRVLSTPAERAFTQLATTAVGAIALTLCLPLYWTPPGAGDILLMVAIGSIAAIGHIALVTAFSHAPASILTPFLYSQVLSAALITMFWFDEPLSASLVLGAAMLVSSGLFLWWQERQASRAPLKCLKMKPGKTDI